MVSGLLQASGFVCTIILREKVKGNLDLQILWCIRQGQLYADKFVVVYFPPCRLTAQLNETRSAENLVQTVVCKSSLQV